MERYNINPIFAPSEMKIVSGPRIIGTSYQKHLRGEWVKAEDALAIEAERNALKAENARLQSELEALKAWRNDWENIPQNTNVLISYAPGPEGEAGLLCWSKGYPVAKHWRFKIIDWN